MESIRHFQTWRKIVWNSVFALSLLIPNLVQTQEVHMQNSYKDFSWFATQPSIFKQFIADPRQIGFFASHRWYDQALGSNIGSVSFGTVLPVWTMRNLEFMGGTDLEIGIQGNVWGCFDLKAYSLDLMNADWMGGIPIALRGENWALRFRLYHISSHLGDEYLVSHPSVTRLNPSFEATDLSYSYDYNTHVRLYAMLGYILHRDASYPMHPVYLEGGFELHGNQLFFDRVRLQAQPYFGAHVRSWEMYGFEPSVNLAAGLLWAEQGQNRGFITSLEYYHGHCLEGQFSRLRTNYLALRVGYNY